jgi:hypothetical protein
MPIISLIYFQNISSVILQCLNLLSTINFCPLRSFCILFDGILQNPRDIRHRPRLKSTSSGRKYRSTKIKAPSFCNESVNDIDQSLLHHILNIHFLRLIPRKCLSQQRNNSRITIRLPLLSISKSAKVKYDSTDIPPVDDDCPYTKTPVQFPVPSHSARLVPEQMLETAQVQYPVRP